MSLFSPLVCFALVAREHKIELTRERLIHEYALDAGEIPRDKLLRMAKDLGLKARVLRLDWERLLNLRQACPAIARLKNGRHVVVTGIVAAGACSGPGPGPCADEPLVGVYDPLAGSGGAHLRLGRGEFDGDTVWWWREQAKKNFLGRSKRIRFCRKENFSTDQFPALVG
ncbi:MAG: hypothetical protein BWK76_24985 [Desulfobulbaceae bacterium A2]|nr:MAG: hypothetical protein BWK76_24985 [Desulfobulbaceae bacterium A2]